MTSIYPWWTSMRLIRLLEAYDQGIISEESLCAALRWYGP